MYFTQVGNTFVEISEKDIVEKDLKPINIDYKNDIFVYDYGEGDEGDEGDDGDGEGEGEDGAHNYDNAVSMLENFVCDKVYYSSKTGKYILVNKRTCTHKRLYFSEHYSRRMFKECENISGECIFDDCICDDTSSDCVSEQYFRHYYELIRCDS